jgi:hypothetical protein
MDSLPQERSKQPLGDEGGRSTSNTVAILRLVTIVGSNLYNCNYTFPDIGATLSTIIRIGNGHMSPQTRLISKVQLLVDFLLWLNTLSHCSSHLLGGCQWVTPCCRGQALSPRVMVRLPSKLSSIFPCSRALQFALVHIRPQPSNARIVGERGA